MKAKARDEGPVPFYGIEDTFIIQAAATGREPLMLGKFAFDGPVYHNST